MQLLRPVINVYEKHIIQQQVLEEIIAVVSLLIGYDQMLELADCDLAQHIGFLAAPFGIQNEKHLILVQYFQQMMQTDHLTVCRRIHKPFYQRRCYLLGFKSSSHYFTFQIPNA